MFGSQKRGEGRATHYSGFPVSASSLIVRRAYKRYTKIHFVFPIDGKVNWITRAHVLGSRLDRDIWYIKVCLCMLTEFWRRRREPSNRTLKGNLLQRLLEQVGVGWPLLRVFLSDDGYVVLLRFRSHFRRLRFRRRHFR